MSLQPYHPWQKYHKKIVSKKGGWRIGQGVVSHGHDLMNDIVGEYSYMELIALNATGRFPEPNLAKWLESVYMCMSWPDPRIWCNRIGAIGGSVGASFIATICAGIMANDSRIYGAKTMIEGARFIQLAQREHDSGVSLDAIVAAQLKGKDTPHIMGYARPIARGDERIEALMRVAKDVGLKKGKHQKLAEQLEEMLHQRYQETMNITGYVSAVLSDYGYTAEEMLRLSGTYVASGIVACYADTESRVEGGFSPLKVSDVRYIGKPPRQIS